MKGFWRGVGLLGLVLALTAPSAYAVPSFVPAGKSFGFNADVYPPDEPAGSPRTLDAAQAAGAEYLRMGIQWRLYHSETSVARPVPPSFSKPKGQPTGSQETDRVDKLYLELQARGMKPVMMIHSAPVWASTFYMCDNPVYALDKKKCPPDWKTKPYVYFTHPDRQDALRAFVAAVVQRYPGAIIEGTNEPDWAREFQPQYHPPLWHIGSAQCALMNAVKVTSPTTRVLSPGFYNLKYFREFWDAMGRNPNCWDDFSFHLFGSVEVRAGFGSGIEAQLNELRSILGAGERLFITETGISDTVLYNDVKFNPKAELTGEALVAHAWPRWIKYFLNQPDVDGVLVHTVRQVAPGNTGDLNGFGLLNPDFSVKTPGAGDVPRFCFLSISSGKTYPGCPAALPPAPSPSAPSFYKPPHLISSQTPRPNDTPRVLFLEDGEPQPNLNIAWYRCNSVGLSCQIVQENKSVYQIKTNDRLSRLKVVVTLWNQHGQTTGSTVLSPIIQ